MSALKTFAMGQNLKRICISKCISDLSRRRLNRLIQDLLKTCRTRRLAISGSFEIKLFSSRDHKISLHYCGLHHIDGEKQSKNYVKETLRLKAHLHDD